MYHRAGPERQFNFITVPTKLRGFVLDRTVKQILITDYGFSSVWHHRPSGGNTYCDDVDLFWDDSSLKVDLIQEKLHKTPTIKKYI